MPYNHTFHTNSLFGVWGWILIWGQNGRFKWGFLWDQIFLSQGKK